LTIFANIGNYVGLTEVSMATMNVSLPVTMKEWIESRLVQGQFSNTSDYIRHLVRQEQVRQDAVAALQRAIDEGLADGEPEPFDMKTFIAEMRNADGEK
jgi:antitoxin ParD1/3/4